MTTHPAAVDPVVRRRHGSTFDGTSLYYLVLALLVLLLSRPAHAGELAVRQRAGGDPREPERAELLGYDIRRYQLVAFVIGSTLAGLSGVLYTAWGQFIVPASMALPAAAMPIIWVAVGGRKDLTATLIGTLLRALAVPEPDRHQPAVRPDRDRRAAAGHHPVHAGRLHRLARGEPAVGSSTGADAARASALHRPATGRRNDRPPRDHAPRASASAASRRSTTCRSRCRRASCTA